MAYVEPCTYSEHKNSLKEKLCSKCRALKPILNFGVRKNKKTGQRYYTSACKECEAKATLRWKHRNKEKARVRQRNSKIKQYGIDINRYEEIKQNQKNKCAICGSDYSIELKGRKLNLAVDHDHSTGAVRGLLCSKCNTGIGCLYSIELLSKAINYITCGKDWRI